MEAWCQGFPLRARYVYRFDYSSAKATAIGLGAFHVFDIPFLFNNLHDPMTALVQEELDIAGSVANALQHAWAQFARNGDPGWNAYRPDDRNFYSLNRTCCELNGYGAGVLEIWT